MGHLASSYSFVVEFNFFKNNHVSYGYVLGSSAHLENSRGGSILPLCLMPHWHVELWLRDILSRTVLEVPSIRVDNCDLVSHNGGGDRHNTRHIFLIHIQQSAWDSHSKSLWPRRLHHIPAVCLLCYSGLEPIRYRRSGLHISTHLGNVLHMHPRCSRSESNIHRCSDSGSIHPLRHASHDIGHGWSAGSEDSSHWISCRPSLRLPHTIVPRIRWWYELGTYAKLHQENVAKHCSRSLPSSIWHGIHARPAKRFCVWIGCWRCSSGVMAGQGIWSPSWWRLRCVLVDKVYNTQLNHYLWHQE